MRIQSAGDFQRIMDSLDLTPQQRQRGEGWLARLTARSEAGNMRTLDDLDGCTAASSSASCWGTGTCISATLAVACGW